MPAANAEAMSLHLTAIGRKVAAGSHAALILDGAGYHLAAALTIPENVTLVRLPPYAPELNPIENVWEYLRGNKLAITVFDDYDDIVDKTCDAWNFFEQDPMRIASITTRTWATVNDLGPLVSFVFARIMLERGFVIGATRLIRRAWQIYVAHIVLLVMYIAEIGYLAHRYGDPNLEHEFNVAGFMANPAETLYQGLILAFKPVNMDVLPLYILLMVAFPPIYGRCCDCRT